MAEQGHKVENGPTVIRKYANRRLYNTATAGFVTLDDLRQMVTAGEDFAVVDAQSGKDITASVLAQIIAEQETRGESLLPQALLKQAISLYERGLGGPFTDYLEQSMSVFSQGFERIGELGELGRRNLELFQTSMGVFSPGARTEPGKRDDPRAKATDDGNDTADAAVAAGLREQVSSLQDELRDLQRRLNTLDVAHKPARSRKRKG
jgi:polyhydroxyalkanoate synthesis repressor PhaR